MVLLLFILCLFSCRNHLPPAEVVNPFIGTSGHGHTFPGATVPFGMVQLSPDTRLEGWDGCSGYHYSDSIIYGFSHTHLSGTGCSDYGDILLIPVNRTVSLTGYGYASHFHKQKEYARAGYYRVTLDSWNIKAELTSTVRTGFHRYTYHKGDSAAIVIDLKHRDECLESGFFMVSDTEVAGYRISRGWAAQQMIYFIARFSRPVLRYSVQCDYLNMMGGKEFIGKSIKSLLYFDNNGDPLLVKVGISATGIDGARKNLDAENPYWDFDAIKDAATRSWNRELSKISANGGTPEQITVFYTALYHLMIQPNIYMDVDHRYRGRDLQIHTADGFDYYTVFSLWDTYRAAHPLLTIIDRKRTCDFIRTFIRQYEEGGALPVWELSGNETGCMIGYHAVPVIADAWLKGIRDFDTLKAFEAMKNSAMQDHLGLNWYKAKGYIPGDKEGESVSKTLEYAYDDWCIAQVAKSLGNHEDYRYYIRRAQNYKNLFDPSTGFIRAKLNETWFMPFDPTEVNFNYTEANAWQYSFYVPQDIGGLMDLMGGKDAFAVRLDSLFASSSETTGRKQADITGLIGQYAHGNEPSHHMAYLYAFTGKPWRTQELVHHICTELYTHFPDGLCGNEDCGQMSAWYLFSVMGFYPVTPASGLYVIGTPLFPEVTIHLENGKDFRICAEGVNNQNFYIQSITLNGKPWNSMFLPHEEITKGGEMVLEMGNVPRCEEQKTKDVTKIECELIEPVPFVVKGEGTFFDSTLIELGCADSNARIYYSLKADDSRQLAVSSGQWAVKATLYQFPIIIHQTSTVTVFAQREDGIKSAPIVATFQKIQKNRKIIINTRYAPQYSAGGDIALIDFRRGTSNFRTGCWQGYEGVDLDVIIDLGKPELVRKLSIGFLQDQGSWIFMPEWVEFMVSADGKNFSTAGKVINTIADDSTGAILKPFSINLNGKPLRYIHIIGKNRGICPQWHPGAGEKAWIFADEIMIE